MMGQQKRSLEFGGSSQFAKCLKQFATSRSKEASEWLKANLDPADEDSEQLDRHLTLKDFLGSSSKERSLQEEPLLNIPNGGDASKAADIGAATDSSLFMPSVKNSTSDFRSTHLEALRAAPDTTMTQICNPAIPCSEGGSLLEREQAKEANGEEPEPHLTAENIPAGKETIEQRSCKLDAAFDHISTADCGDKELLTSLKFVGIVQNALEARKVKACRPLPAMVGDKEVNLFLLSRIVKGIGGYTKVTQGGSWRDISEGLGFGSDCGPCLKLVYVKYLKLLESGKILGSMPCKSDQGISTSQALNPKPAAPDEHEKQSCQISSNAALIVAGGSRTPKTKKQDPIVDAIRWIRRVGVEPGNPKKGRSWRPYQRNEHWVEACATLANNICFCLRKNVSSK